MIQVSSINKSFGDLPVLRDVSLTIGSGELVTIVGASGAGKTTLLQIMGTLERADSGQIIINDTDVSKLSEKKLASFRNTSIGFIFQFHQLLPEFTALENVCLPAWINKASKNETRKRAEELLDILGMSHRLDHKPTTLSGGEAQRVAVARALINNPAVVFADEPSGNLDSANAKELHQLFFKLRDHYNQTFVIVTHNETLAESADRRVLMKDGQIVNN
ncbi:MAG: ABC transporter ATP-binding protein [Bacteroidota bacterium]